MSTKFLLSALAVFVYSIIPQISSANQRRDEIYAVGDSFLLSILFILFVFLGVWAIEGSLLQKRLGGSRSRSFWAVLLGNTFSVIAIFLLWKITPFLFPLLGIFPIFFVASYFVAVIFEFSVLWVFYAGLVSLKKIVLFSLSANSLSYLFILMAFFAFLLPIGIVIIFPLVAFLLVRFLFRSFGDPNLSKKGKIISTITTIAIFVLSVFGAIWIIKTTPSPLAMPRDSRRVAELKSVQNGLELYFSKEKKYPIPVDMDNSWSGLERALVEAGLGIERIPDDPTGEVPYGYGYGASIDGSSYVLRAKLEQVKSKLLLNDVDGNVHGLDCDDGDDKNYYCVTP